MFVNYYDNKTQTPLFGRKEDNPPAIGNVVTHKDKEYRITDIYYYSDKNPELYDAFIEPVIAETDIEPGTKILIGQNVPVQNTKFYNVRGKRAIVTGIDDSDNNLRYRCKLKPEFGMTMEEILLEFVLEREQFEVI